MVTTKRLTLYLIIMLNFLLRFVAAGLFGRVRFFSLYLAALFIIFRFSLLHCISIVMFRFLFERFTHTRFEIHLACYYVASEIISLARAQPCIYWKKQNILARCELWLSVFLSTEVWKKKRKLACIATDYVISCFVHFLYVTCRMWMIWTLGAIEKWQNNRCDAPNESLHSGSNIIFHA